MTMFRPRAAQARGLNPHAAHSPATELLHPKIEAEALPEIDRGPAYSRKSWEQVAEDLLRPCLVRRARAYVAVYTGRDSSSDRGADLTGAWRRDNGLLKRSGSRFTKQDFFLRGGLNLG